MTFAREFKCPHCGFFVEVESGRIVKTPAVKAEYEEYCNVKKSTQSRLEDADEGSKEKPK